MSDQSGRGPEAEEDDRRLRMPPPAEIPPAPKLQANLPPRPPKAGAGTVEPGSYNKMAIAATAASSFVMPVIVLSVGGYLLDAKLHHSTSWLAFIGVILGLVAGTASLLKIIGRLQD